MVRLALVCCGLLATAPAEPEFAVNTRPSTYEEARVQFGPGFVSGSASEGQVKLALWCEAHGLSAERVKHLARAVLIDPSNVTARGLLGLISDGKGHWQGPDQAAEKERENAALAEYNTRRASTPETADAQWALALWCETHRLKAEATAHLTTVTRLDPSRTLAWKHLGFIRDHGRWITPEGLAADKAEARAQLEADRYWRPRLGRLKGYLAFRDAGKRDQAMEALLNVRDPRAVPTILAVFNRRDEDSQRLAVQLLGGIDAPSASRALADLSTSAASPAVRKAAAETLRLRDPKEFLERLIARLVDPIRYQVKPVGGPGQAGELFVEGDRFNLDRVYSSPPLPIVPVTPGSVLDRDQDGDLVLWVMSVLPTPAQFGVVGLPWAIESRFGPNSGLASVAWRRSPIHTTAPVPVSTAVPIQKMTEEIQQAAYESRIQQRDDVGVLERQNAAVLKANDPVVVTLEAVLGWSAGSTRSDWDRWWNHQRGYLLASRSDVTKPTVYESVAPAYTPRPIDQYQFNPQIGYYLPNRDCFVAGTPVRTLDGLRPIESIKLGDRVLAQNTTTGALSYRPVIAVYPNPPAETLTLGLGNERVVTTGIQRFWKARKGWVMARDLIPGDHVRTLGGLIRVDLIERGETLPVFNLEIASSHDFFVGASGMLVHDHTEVEPVHAPFDAEPSLANERR